MVSGRVKYLAFVVTVVCCVMAMRTGVFASMDGTFSSFCSSWQGAGDYNCSDCEYGTGIAPAYGADGSCDFSGITDEEDLLQTAAAYIQSSEDACFDACGADYADYLADWAFWGVDEHNPCYEAMQDPNNYDTWGDGGGEAGPESTWSCSCHSFFFGECGQ